MKILLFIVGAGIVIYFILKLCLYIYRPFFLSKTFREIDSVYDRLITSIDKDIDSALENYHKWKVRSEELKIFSSEENLIKGVDSAKEAKAHEEQVHEKFLRLRERFIGDPKKLSEAIVTYQRYLTVKLKQHQDASLFSDAVTSGVLSFDEMMAVAKETMVVLEENERKLDILLS